jgi:hypothetical protein
MSIESLLKDGMASEVEISSINQERARIDESKSKGGLTVPLLQEEVSLKEREIKLLLSTLAKERQSNDIQIETMESELLQVKLYSLWYEHRLTLCSHCEDLPPLLPH